MRNFFACFPDVTSDIHSSTKISKQTEGYILKSESMNDSILDSISTGPFFYNYPKPSSNLIAVSCLGLNSISLLSVDQSKTRKGSLNGNTDIYHNPFLINVLELQNELNCRLKARLKLLKDKESSKKNEIDKFNVRYNDLISFSRHFCSFKGNNNKAATHDDTLNVKSSISNANSQLLSVQACIDSMECCLVDFSSKYTNYHCKLNIVEQLASQVNAVSYQNTLLVKNISFLKFYNSKYRAYSKKKRSRKKCLTTHNLSMIISKAKALRGQLSLTRIRNQTLKQSNAKLKTMLADEQQERSIYYNNCLQLCNTQTAAHSLQESKLLQHLGLFAKCHKLMNIYKLCQQAISFK